MFIARAIIGATRLNLPRTRALTVIRMSFVPRHIPCTGMVLEPVLELQKRDLARCTFRICCLYESCPCLTVRILRSKSAVLRAKRSALATWLPNGIYLMNGREAAPTKLLFSLVQLGGLEPPTS